MERTTDWTKEENKMDIDFQVGDEVETVRYMCKGVITEIMTGKCDYPILVKWGNANTDSYDISGKVLTSDDCQSIYHAGSIKREGHKIIIDPVKPERESWSNIYLDKNGDPFFGARFNTHIEATTHIGDGSRGEYVTTIQLKRKKS